MSWFSKLFKKAQVWRPDPIEKYDFNEYTEANSFEVELKELYRLYYIYYEISTKIKGQSEAFSQRFANILNNLSKAILTVGNSLRKKILLTFEKWLDAHAILNPKQWAEARLREDRDRVEYGGEGTYLDSALSEYRTYNQSVKDYYIVTMIMNKINETPYFKQYLQSYVGEYIDSYAEEELREIYSVPENVDPYSYVKQQLNSGAYNFEDVLPMEFDTLTDILASDISLDEEVAFVFYKDYIFPLWYSKWSQRGIEQTRATVENNFELLKNVDGNNVGQLVAAVNIGLNTAHQNGSMLEYFEQDYGADRLDRLFEDLTKGRWNIMWDQQINELFGLPYKNIRVDAGDYKIDPKTNKFQEYKIVEI